ncbi:MAG: N-acetyl-gamma-glutamyl-phosphate reductase [Planctomycetales bacterium]|nr:N-acetyl-gamma-glutamyl-phosphate reductase [Planctomycetales bacterium]
MIRVGILGATGYTALETIKILLRHPEVTITAVTSRQDAGQPIAATHRSLVGRLDLDFEESDVPTVAAKTDVILSCLPHGASAEFACAYLAAGKRVIDFSADYRLNDLDTFRAWYGDHHPDGERVGKVVYGLPELFRDSIRQADLVANPGCFPTTAILALAPFVKAGLVDPQSVIVDSKTGVSGGGRTPKLNFHYPECNESISAYGVGTHRHMPEIDHILKRYTGTEVSAIFTPHLAPMDRGILSTIYATPVEPMTQDAALDVLLRAYADEPFVQVVDHLPATKDVAHTNYCHLTARIVKGRLVLVSCIDNLIKGASGAAVQNLNCMFGLPETLALRN